MTEDKKTIIAERTKNLERLEWERQAFGLTAEDVRQQVATYGAHSPLLYAMGILSDVQVLFERTDTDNLDEQLETARQWINKVKLIMGDERKKIDK